MTANDAKGDGPVVLVLGGAQGIGRGVADLLSDRGHRVHVNARDEAKRSRLREAGVPASRIHGGDLVEPGVAEGIVRAVLATEGRIDGVVHAIGPYTTAPFSETSLADVRAMHDGNVVTAWHAMGAARDALRASRGAFLCFGCAGLERWRAREVTAAYISAKAALLVLVRAFALEEAPHGVRANMISPGFVPHEGAAPDTVKSELHDRIPMGRPARMEEVAGLAAWLLSGESTHVTGQNIEAAGGWML